MNEILSSFTIDKTHNKSSTDIFTNLSPSIITERRFNNIKDRHSSPNTTARCRLKDMEDEENTMYGHQSHLDNKLIEQPTDISDDNDNHITDVTEGNDSGNDAIDGSRSKHTVQVRNRKKRGRKRKPANSSADRGMKRKKQLASSSSSSTSSSSSEEEEEGGKKDKEKFHMQKLFKCIDKKKQLKQQRGMIRKIKKQIYAVAKTNKTPSANDKRNTKRTIRNTDDDDDDDDYAETDADDGDDDMSGKTTNNSNYKKELHKHYDGKDGDLWSSDHVDFVNLLMEKVNQVQKMPLKRIKELDEELEIDDIPLFEEDSILENNTNQSRTPSRKIPESVFTVLKDGYKNSTCLKTILKKLLPFVRVPYLEKKKQKQKKKKKL